MQHQAGSVYYFPIDDPYESDNYEEEDENPQSPFFKPKKASEDCLTNETPSPCLIHQKLVNEDDVVLERNVVHETPQSFIKTILKPSFDVVTKSPSSVIKDADSVAKKIIMTNIDDKILSPFPLPPKAVRNTPVSSVKNTPISSSIPHRFFDYDVLSSSQLSIDDSQIMNNNDDVRLRIANRTITQNEKIEPVNNQFVGKFLYEDSEASDSPGEVIDYDFLAAAVGDYEMLEIISNRSVVNNDNNSSSLPKAGMKRKLSSVEEETTSGKRFCTPPSYIQQVVQDNISNRILSCNNDFNSSSWKESSFQNEGSPLVEISNQNSGIFNNNSNTNSNTSNRIASLFSTGTGKKCFIEEKTFNKYDDKINKLIEGNEITIKGNNNENYNENQNQINSKNTSNSNRIASLFSTGTGKKCFIEEKTFNKYDDEINKLIEGKETVTINNNNNNKSNNNNNNRITSLFSSANGNKVSFDEKNFNKHGSIFEEEDIIKPSSNVASNLIPSLFSTGTGKKCFVEEKTFKKYDVLLDQNPGSEISKRATSLFQKNEGKKNVIDYDKPVSNDHLVEVTPPVKLRQFYKQTNSSVSKSSAGKAFVLPRPIDNESSIKGMPSNNIRSSITPSTVSVNRKTSNFKTPLKISSNDVILSKTAVPIKAVKHCISNTKIIVPEIRVSLSDVFGLVPDHYNFEEFSLYNPSLHHSIYEVNASNASYVVFEGENYTPMLPFPLPLLGDDAIASIRVALIDKGMSNNKEFTFQWTRNHFRWIVWKLASMDRTRRIGNDSMHLNPFLTRDRVLNQLEYRIARELDNSKRSCLHMIHEKDRNSSAHMILCVCGIHEKQKDAKTCIIELTDGWYGVLATCDVSLTEAVHGKDGKGKKSLRIGQKIHVFGATLTGNESGVHPLECEINNKESGHAKVYLNLCVNGTRLAKWDSKLGFNNVPYFCLPLDKIYENGGFVPAVDVVVSRVYKMKYKINGSKDLFSEAELSHRESMKSQPSELEDGESYVQPNTNTEKIRPQIKISVIPTSNTSKGKQQIWDVVFWDNQAKNCNESFSEGQVFRLFGFTPDTYHPHTLKSTNYSTMQKINFFDISTTDYEPRIFYQTSDLSKLQKGDQFDIIAFVVLVTEIDANRCRVFLSDECLSVMHLEMRKTCWEAYSMKGGSVCVLTNLKYVIFNPSQNIHDVLWDDDRTECSIKSNYKDVEITNSVVQLKKYLNDPLNKIPLIEVTHSVIKMSNPVTLVLLSSSYLSLEESCISALYSGTYLDQSFSSLQCWHSPSDPDETFPLPFPDIILPIHIETKNDLDGIFQPDVFSELLDIFEVNPSIISLIHGSSIPSCNKIQKSVSEFRCHVLDELNLDDIDHKGLLLYCLSWKVILPNEEFGESSQCIDNDGILKAIGNAKKCVCNCENKKFIPFSSSEWLTLVSTLARDMNVYKLRFFGDYEKYEKPLNNKRRINVKIVCKAMKPKKTLNNNV